jgi:toxin ParE1/3/4
MVKYRLTPAAKTDLQEIWNYTCDIWGENKAEQYLLHIESKINLLAENPELGRSRPEIKEDYFSFLAEKHIIFHIKAKKHIQIIAVLHGKMDINKQLLM